MSEQNYAGGYMGWDSIMGYTLSVYKPNGTSAHFLRMMGRWFFVNTAVHEAEGTALTLRMHPLLSPSRINEVKALIVPGEKIVHDNSGTRSADYVEYLVFAYEPFWDDKDFENPSLNDDSSVPDDWAEKLNAIYDTGKDKVDNSPEKQKGKKKTSGGTPVGGDADASKPASESEKKPEPKPEPPYIMTFEPPKVHIFIGLPDPGEEGQPPEKSGGRWRRKRKDNAADGNYVDDARDCEEWVEPIPGDGNQSDNRKHFRYIFAFQGQVWVTSYSANIYSFTGVTDKGETVLLPVFISAEQGKNVPWLDMFTTLKQYYISGIDYLIYRDYDKVVEPSLKEVFPDAILLGAIWDLPQDAPLKKRAEEVRRISEDKIKYFWYSPGSIQTTVQLQEAVERFIDMLVEYFSNYTYQSKLDLPVDIPDTLQNNVVAATIQTPATQQEQSESEPEEKEITPVNYCFVLELSFWLQNAARQRIAVFNRITNGQIEKSVLTELPENVNDAVWEEAISKATEKLGAIKYLLFRGCSVNTWTLNKGILPDTVWCGSIADIEYNEPSRVTTLPKFNELEHHFSGFGGGCKDLENCYEMLKEHLGKIGVSDVESV